MSASKSKTAIMVIVRSPKNYVDRVVETNLTRVLPLFKLTNEKNDIILVFEKTAHFCQKFFKSPKYKKYIQREIQKAREGKSDGSDFSLIFGTYGIQLRF